MVPAWPAWPVNVIFKPGLSGDGGHNANGKILFFQHRTLLDVSLDIAQQVFWIHSCGF
ncbi:MAG: hypothetical protein WDN00_05295 [Limisphaerales bacterium]